MISSTARDLPEYRPMVMEACLSQGFRPIMMEHLAGQDRSATDVSVGMVEDADVYLGIFAHSYGSSPAGDPRSYTEIEFDKALNRGIPIIPFLMHPEHPWLPGRVDKGDGAARLERLKTRVQDGRIVKWFKSPEDLRGLVIQALAELKNREQEGDDDVWQSLYPRFLLTCRLLDIDRLRRRLHSVADLHDEWCVALPEGEQRYSSLGAAAGKHPRLVVVGRAGSGKTIALKQLLRSALNEAVTDAAAPRPVWIQASEFSADAPDLAAMESFVCQQVLQLTHGASLTDRHVRDAISSGRCLFLVDGLDELPRKQWKQRIQSLLGFLQNYDSNRFVITTRPEVLSADIGIPELRMPALNPAAQQKLVAVLTAREGDASSRFSEWLKQHPAMRELADTPFFLHVLVERFRKDQVAAPEHPAALLIDVVKQRLIEEYSTHTNTGCWRKLSEDGWADSDVVQEGLQVLADFAFETLKSQTSNRLPLDRAVALQQKVPSGTGPKDNFVFSASGLDIYSLTPRELVFHQVLWRDLLCAYKLLLQYTETAECGIPATAFEAGANSAWKQTAVFLTQLLDARDLSACYRRWQELSPHFIAAVVADGGSIGNAESRAHLRTTFRAEIDRDANHLAARRLAAEALSRAGDDRLWKDPERPVAPMMVPIPPGTYRVGLSQPDLRKLYPLQETAELEFEDEEFNCSPHRLDDFAISRFPITNAHFAHFVDDGAYRERVWWDEAGWAWLQSHGAGKRRPDHWDDRRYNLRNQPLVGITWHEARSYVRWLSTLAPDGAAYRLPSVAEWQAACRGTAGRLYPWGDDPLPVRCNCWHAEDLGAPSPVGIYAGGATPEGVCDLAGNVAEWALSEAGVPVVCGGSWFRSIHRSRATQISRVDPEASSSEIGFRVIAPGISARAT